MGYAAVFWFGGVTMVLLMAAFLNVGPANSVVFPWLNLTLPETCTSRALLGFECPGCGLTRSFVLIAHGDWTTAWRLNWVSFFVFGYALMQLPLALTHGCLSEIERKSQAWYRRWIWLNERLLIALAVLLLLRWTWRLLTGDPM